MPYYTIPGFEGKVFAPEASHAGGNKHNCADCFSCQMCSDERCEACIKKNSCGNYKKHCNDKPIDSVNGMTVIDGSG